MRTAIELFSGACGGWALGNARAGVVTIAGCEKDPERGQLYANRWGVPVYPEVRLLHLVEDLPRPWLLCGSPPCQDASEINQTGKGVDGDETGLFFDAIELAGRLRPAWLALENVGAIRTRGADRIINAMAEAGYPARSIVVGSSEAGKDHDRQRVFFIAPDTASAQGWSAGQSREAACRALARRWDFPGLENRRDGVAHLRASAIGRHLREYDELPAGVAERARSAFGDTLDPIFPQVIANALISWEEAGGRR